MTVSTSGDPTERRAVVVREGLCWYVMRYVGPRVLYCHAYRTLRGARKAAAQHLAGTQ